jgi:hypothetical protein
MLPLATAPCIARPGGEPGDFALTMPSPLTRARAWALRTFAGRSRSEAGWEESVPVGIRPPERFRVGGLVLVVLPVGVRAVGVNPASAVFEVRIEPAAGVRAWSSRYGLPALSGAREAATTALDELWEIWSDREGWQQRLTTGVSEDEAEALLDSPGSRADVKTAIAVGAALATGRDNDGAWLLEEVAAG